jgi:hypothetical protein
MGPISCPETSVTSYQSTLRNIPEERRLHNYIYVYKYSVNNKLQVSAHQALEKNLKEEKYSLKKLKS